MVATSIGLLLGAELLLRLVFPNGIAGPGALAYQFDEDHLISLKPNVQKTYTRRPEDGGDTIAWGTNADAFRGAELVEAPRVRILVYGDSNVQARFSRRGDSYVGKLQEYLEAAGLRDLEVVNAGVVGFGPDQSLLKLEREVDVYQPDVVIFHVFADNDFGDIVRNRLFDLDENGSLVATDHERAVDEVLLRNDPSGFASSLFIVRAVYRVLSVVFGVELEHDTTPPKLPPQDWLGRVRDLVAEENEVFRAGRRQLHSHFADHYDLDVAIDPDGESSQAKAGLMAAVLRRAKTVADRRGIAFLVVIQPSRIDMTSSQGTIGYQHLRVFPEYRRTNLSARVKDICAQDAIDCIDLFGLFEQNDPGNLYFAAPNDHWNDRGQDLAAREVASWLAGRIHAEAQRP